MMDTHAQDGPSNATQASTTNLEETEVEMQGLKFDVFVDFDGTIIKENTIPWMDHLRRWPESPRYQDFLEAYMEDYKQWNIEQGPAAQRKTLKDEYDYLESLLAVEAASIARIEAGGWLQGVYWSEDNTSMFDDAVAKVKSSREIPWRENLHELYEYVLLSNPEGRMAILSVHWSEQFIRALLRTRKWFGFAKAIDVYCNEIDPSGSGYLSRHVRLWDSTQPGVQHRVWPPWYSPGKPPEDLDHLWTAFDKATFLWLKGRIGRPEDSLVVYIGDSKTDLQCLMDADIGIRVTDCAEEASLSEILERLNIRQLPIERLVTDYVHHNLVEVTDIDPDDTGMSTTLINEQWKRQIIWVAEDFTQIKNALKAFSDANLETNFNYYKPSKPPESSSRQGRRPSFTKISRRDSGVDEDEQ